MHRVTTPRRKPVATRQSDTGPIGAKSRRTQRSDNLEPQHTNAALSCKSPKKQARANQSSSSLSVQVPDAVQALEEYHPMGDLPLDPPIKVKEFLRKGEAVFPLKVCK
ncbi:hypothetical protein KIPB_008326, partial [Kipferlia bialata]|eukprot:g8326.t1